MRTHKNNLKLGTIIVKYKERVVDLDLKENMISMLFMINARIHTEWRVRSFLMFHNIQRKRRKVSLLVQKTNNTWGQSQTHTFKKKVHKMLKDDSLFEFLFHSHSRLFAYADCSVGRGEASI